MKIRVKIRDKVGKSFSTVEYTRIKNEQEFDLEKLARACERIIRATIMEKADKPIGYLASQFLAERITNGWGVGDIDRLDTNAPYWNHQDKGSEGIGANWQHTLPKGFWQDGRWIESEDGYFVKPKTPIPAMNYIAETLAKMEIETKIILRT